MTDRVALIVESTSDLERLDARAYALLARERTEPLFLVRGLGAERMRRLWHWTPWLTEAELDERLLRIRQRDPVCRPFNDAYGAREDLIPVDAVPADDGRWHLVHPDTGDLLFHHRTSSKSSGGTLIRIIGDPDWAVRVPRVDRCFDTYRMLQSWPGWGKNGIDFADAQPPTVRRPKPATVWRYLYVRQGLKCAACRRRLPHVIDHDHHTLLVRGLLCVESNTNEPRLPTRSRLL